MDIPLERLTKAVEAIRMLEDYIQHLLYQGDEGYEMIDMVVVLVEDLKKLQIKEDEVRRTRSQ